MKKTILLAILAAAVTIVLAATPFVIAGTEQEANPCNNAVGPDDGIRSCEDVANLFYSGANDETPETWLSWQQSACGCDHFNDVGNGPDDGIMDGAKCGGESNSCNDNNCQYGYCN